MQDREALERALSRAKRALAILEEEVAGYGALHVPVDLKIELEEKQNEVKSLEARLAQLDGRRPANVPNTLLRRPDIFVGRKDEIARCMQALDPQDRGGWGVVIDGIGGIGKTALALEVAHRALEQAWFDAYLFASAKTTWLTPEGVRQETLALSSLDAFVREFARALGQSDIAQISDATERRRALLDALRGRRALLIWDNLETLLAAERDAIAEFLRMLPSPNKAIITSRHRTGVSPSLIRLDRLSEQEAFELMREKARRLPRLAAELARADEQTRRAIYETAGGNPLVIEWILGQVALKGCSLAQALARLQDAARSQDVYAFLFADSARDLTPNDRAVLSALSGFQTPAGVGALADVTSLTPNEITLSIEKLVMLSLVNDLEDERYGLHPLVRAYVHAAMGAGSPAAAANLGGITLDPAAHRKTLRYWVDYARKHGGDHKDAYKTFDRLEAEWPNLDAAASALWEMTGLPGPVRDKEAAKMLLDLAYALSNFTWIRGYWDEGVRLGEWGYQAAQGLEEWSNAGWRAQKVAFIHYYRAETDLAGAWAERMAQAMERGGSRRERAVATHLRGLVAQQRGDLDEAGRLLTEALAAYRDLGEESDQAIVLNDLAGVARERKDYARADQLYRQALAIDEKIGNKESQASRCGNLGNLALDREEWDAARQWFERELPLAREVGRQDLIAQAQQGLARVLEHAGRYAEALPLAQEALRIREKLRDQRTKWSRELVERLEKKA